MLGLLVESLAIEGGGWEPPQVVLSFEWGEGSFSNLYSLFPGSPGSHTALVDLCDLDCTSVRGL